MKDLTKIKTPFGLLKPKVQDRLLAHLRANGLIEMFWSPAWKDSTSDRFDDRFTYRAKPGFPILPENKTVAALREEFKTTSARYVCMPADTPIFAAVKEWQEARAGNSWRRVDAATAALVAIKVPS